MGANRIITYDDIKKEFEFEEYKLISDNYINNRQELEYLCIKHEHRGIQKIKYVNFQRGSRCPFCMYENGKQPKPIPQVLCKEEAEKLNYIYQGTEYINGKTVINFLCSQHIEKGIQKANWTSVRLGQCSCKYCLGISRTTEEFESLVREKLPNIKIVGKYTKARSHIDCCCEVCNYEWSPFAYNLLSGFGCPMCANNKVGMLKRTSQEQKMKKLISCHPEINFKSIPERTTDKVECECKVCKHTWFATYSNLVNPHLLTSCPKCNMSHGEKTLLNILEDWEFEYITQYKFPDCRNVFELPFDVYLPKFNVLIEYDGEQHYHPIPRGNGDGVEDFYKIQNNDEIKTQYCKDKNIPLIRIPYWEFDDMEYFLFNELVKLKVIKEIKSA